MKEAGQVKAIPLIIEGSRLKLFSDSMLSIVLLVRPGIIYERPFTKIPSIKEQNMV